MALSEHDLAAIRAAIEKDAAAVRRADWDAITRMFTADAIHLYMHSLPSTRSSVLNTSPKHGDLK